jgi:prepilin-type N-terminal cleavage/methylation domain-containing protein
MRRQHARGLTLVELLVAIVVLGFVMTLVAQAVFQVSRITRVADSATRGLAGRWAEGWALQGTLGSLAMPEESTALPFEGTSRRIRSHSTVSMDGTDVGVQGFEFELRPDDQSPAGTDVWALTAGTERSMQVEMRVARFNGSVEFAFVDRAGRTLAAWPPVTRGARGIDPEDLPSAVVVRSVGSPKRIVHWYSYGGETSRPPPAGKPFWELQ